MPTSFTDRCAGLSHLRMPSPQEGYSVSRLVLKALLIPCLAGITTCSLRGETSRLLSDREMVEVPPGPGVVSQPARLTAEEQRLFNDYVDLLTEQNTRKARRTGARELLNRGWPQAIEVLVEVLENEKDPIAQMAVIEVIAASAQPNPVFIQPLIQLLGSKDEKMRDAAADALARFNDGGVVDRLSELAKGQGQPVTDLAMRVAAIRALSLVSDRSKAMEVLIELLRDPNPEVRVRAAQAVSDAAGTNFGGDIRAIEKWWEVDRQRSELNWLRDRLQVKIKQNRNLQKKIEGVQTILVDTLRKLYLRMPSAQKIDTLLEYLQDSMPEVRLLGLELVNSMLKDREPVPESVLRRLRLMIPDVSPRVRRQVVLTLRDLHDVTDAKLILAQYRLETDSTVRAAMLNALGRLGDAEAIGVMIEALSSDDKQVVAAGALGLATLSEEGHLPPEGISPAIEPLKQCYQKLAESDQELRAQLLEAMARLADPKFTPIFAGALSSENAAPVRQAAARGIAAIGKAENANLLVDQLADPDPGVRRTVVDALARIAKPEHLEVLFARLDAKTESDATVRSRAWEGILAILKTLPPDEQRQWIAGRIDPKTDKQTAERYVELMTDIERALASGSISSEKLLTVREELADGLRFAGQFAEAARFYKLVYDVLSQTRSDHGWSVGLKLMQALLQANRYEEAVPLVVELEKVANRRQRDLVDEAIHDHMSALIKAGEPDKALDVLRQFAERHEPGWMDRFAKLRAKARELQGEQDIATVRRCLTLMRGDPDEVERAQQQIRALGPRAIKPLAKELRAVLTADEADPMREKLVYDLLKLVAPSWRGYPDNAAGAIKVQEVDRIIEDNSIGASAEAAGP